MQSNVSTLPRPGRAPAEAATAARPSRIAQALRRFIETSPWDEKLLKQERWLDAGCLALLAISVLYFIPVCLRILRG
jgi:hypothetical protein